MTAISHRFVDLIPEDLEDGVVYVCVQYETVSHLCLCGCRNEVVSPLHPQQWSLSFDGSTISLTPSIGNWSFPCQSHYWIHRSQVRWAKGLGSDQISKLRAREQRLLEDHYEAQLDTEPDRKTLIPAVSRLRNQIAAWLRRSM